MHSKLSRLWTLGAAAYLLTALAAMARAEPIPQDSLAADHHACIATCTQRGLALASCTPYCDCTFKQIGAQFTLEEYKAAGSQNQPPTKDLIDRMAKITQICLAEMK